MDAPLAAKSGHQGTAMALAPLAHVLYSRVMRFDPADPQWVDRDRFILSGGHASILQYSMLYLAGFGLSLDDIKNFRQWGSATPGHPEVGHTAGVEVTTGPLGQGFANAVGMAIAEAHLRAVHGSDAVSHHTWVVAGDGCLMEGISHEAASLAGHLGLDRLVCIFDDNRITIDGSVDLACSDDVPMRFRSYGWNVIDAGDPGDDLDAIEKALLEARARGADVRVVYAPLDVLAIALAQPQCRVVFLAVGFETTAPATALLALQAHTAQVGNLELLVCHVRVPPVLDQMLAEPACRVQAVLAAGHVCTVMGAEAYVELAQRHRRPIVITGFSAAELLRGILAAVRQLEAGEHRLENAYRPAVREGGNAAGQALLERVFEPVDAPWRGLGVIAGGGYRLKAPFDQLAVQPAPSAEPCAAAADCPAGAVLQGLIKPHQCPQFGRRCTPEHPLGAPMVSSEGACAAYHRYQG